MNPSGNGGRCNETQDGPGLHDRLFERRGQHVYFEAPGRLTLDGVYAFAKSKGLTVLDVRPMAGHYVVKAVDTP